ERVLRIGGPLDLAAEVDVVADRAEALERELLLALVTDHEVEPALGSVDGVLEDCTGVLDLDGGVGNDVVEALTVLGGEDRLVLVGHQHVTGAAEEGSGGVTTAAREGDDV